MRELVDLIADADTLTAEPVTSATTRRCAHLVRVGDVQARVVDWLWKPYLPAGMVSIIDGDPASGKSYLTLALATSISRGYALPGADGIPGGPVCEPRDVVIMSAEDPIAHVIRPRLDRMGADVARVHVLEGIAAAGDNPIKAICLADIDVIGDAIEKVKPALVVVDPIQAYLGADVDLHRANETRPILSGLSTLAESTGVAILLVRHLRKSGADRSIYRGLGSIDIMGAARSALMAGKDPENPTRRHLLHIKSSFAGEGPALEYSIDDQHGLTWVGLSTMTADEMLAPKRQDPRGQRRDEAADWLRDALADGPVASKKLEVDAKDKGLAWPTVKRAKERLGILSTRVGTAWQWSLPPKSEDDDDDDRAEA